MVEGFTLIGIGIILMHLGAFKPAAVTLIIGIAFTLGGVGVLIWKK